MKRMVCMYGIIICILFSMAACSYNKKDEENVKRHEKFIDAGTHSIRLVIAEGNSHDIMTENPYLVLRTVVELANTIRSK